MKRYNHYKIVLPVSADELDVAYVECKNGNWVKWKDVEILVGKLKGNETKIARIEDGCNCEDVANELQAFKNAGILGKPSSWICPAHGYKKI